MKGKRYPLDNRCDTKITFPLCFMHANISSFIKSLYAHLLKTFRFDKVRFSLPPNLSSPEEIYKV